MFFLEDANLYTGMEKKWNSISTIADINRHPRDTSAQYLTILQKRRKIKAVQYTPTKVFRRLLSVLQGQAERFRDLPRQGRHQHTQFPLDTEIIALNPIDFDETIMY